MRAAGLDSSPRCHEDQGRGQWTLPARRLEGLSEEVMLDLGFEVEAWFFRVVEAGARGGRIG